MEKMGPVFKKKAANSLIFAEFELRTTFAY